MPRTNTRTSVVAASAPEVDPPGAAARVGGAAPAWCAHRKLPPTIMDGPVDELARRGDRGIWEYLQDPTPRFPSTARHRGPEFLRLLGLCLLIALATGPLTAVVSAIGDADNRLDDVSPLFVVIVGVFVAPILEELTFRLPLGPLRPWWLLV